jgi:phosphoserine/homoserine phosphotransferase
MYIACLDLEGVLVPEIWVAFAEKTGIDAFRLTTREEPDYDKLMRYRIDLLRRHRLGFREIESVIDTLEPFPGARAFLDELRAKMQVVLISDTFDIFGRPLMKKLGWPSLFCNELSVASTGEIVAHRMRCPNSKLTTVQALQTCGFDTIAAGDSFNDLPMIRASKAGFLFRAPSMIKASNPDVPAFETYDDLKAAVFAEMSGQLTCAHR